MGKNKKKNRRVTSGSMYHVFRLSDSYDEQQAEAEIDHNIVEIKLLHKQMSQLQKKYEALSQQLALVPKIAECEAKLRAKAQAENDQKTLVEGDE